MKAKFALGQTVITANAQISLHPDDVMKAICRHIQGDWGNVSEEDRAANDFALVKTLRIFSVYYDRNGTKFWVITEADRSSTTVLLPEDY